MYRCESLLCTTIEPSALGPAGGRPLVIADPMGAVAQQFMSLGAAVVQEVAKLKLRPRNSVRYMTTSFATMQIATPPKWQLAGHEGTPTV